MPVIVHSAEVTKDESDNSLISAQWTVPEAAVWIATRKLTAVESLDPNARASLFVASEVVPRTYEASFELLAGLRTGRLLASGCRRGRQIREEIEPNYWRFPTEFRAGDGGVEAVRASGDAVVSLLLAPDDVMSRWESPQSLLDNGKILLGVAIQRLMHESFTDYVLRYPEVGVTGLNDRGERVEIDKGVFQRSENIDRASHSLTTADGGLHWSEVMLEYRKEEREIVREDGLAVSRACLERESAKEARNETPSKRKGGRSKIDDSAIVANVRAAMAADPSLSRRKAVLRYIPNTVTSGREQEATIRRIGLRFAKP